MAFVGRFVTSAEVMLETRKVRADDFAKRLMPDKARWHLKLRRYLKRLEPSPRLLYL